MSFQLIARPICVCDDVWIAAEVFVGPGVTIGNGCVLGARACAFGDLDAWMVYRGNPARAVKPRPRQTPARGRPAAGGRTTRKRP
jgi:putative colanic acid biosynthesis acetyltransferase WcaF